MAIRPPTRVPLYAAATCLALAGCARWGEPAPELQPAAGQAQARPRPVEEALDNPEALADYVGACEAGGRSEEAFARLARLYRESPSNAALAQALYPLAFRQERYALAAEAYLAVMAAAPDETTRHYREGLCHAAAGHRDGARLIWERLLQRHPGHTAAQTALDRLDRLP